MLLPSQAEPQSPPNLSFSANATNTYYNFILSDPNYIQLTNYLHGFAADLLYELLSHKPAKRLFLTIKPIKH